MAMTEAELKDFLYAKYESGELTEALEVVNNGGTAPVTEETNISNLIESFTENIGNAKKEEIQEGNTRYEVEGRNTQMRTDIQWLMSLANSGANQTKSQRKANRTYIFGRTDFDV